MKIDNIITALESWLSRAEKKREEIVEHPDMLDEVVECRLEVGELSESDIDTIDDILSGYYDGDMCEPDVEEHYFDGDCACGKRISYDRYFDETYEYKDGILVVSTGFKYSYWTAMGELYDTFDDEDTYERFIEECVSDGDAKDENTLYYEELRSCGWNPEADIK